MDDTVPNAQPRVKRSRRLKPPDGSHIYPGNYTWTWGDIQPEPADNDDDDSRPWDSYVLQDPSLTPGRRLELLRTRLIRVKSAAEMARRIGVNEVTYQHHENGTRRISLKAANVYADYFGVAVDLLLSGAGILVEVLGAITAGGTIIDRMLLDIQLPRVVYFARPPIKNDAGRLVLGAYVVIDDLYPAYRPGDIVHFDQSRSLSPDEASGRECVVELADRRRLLRIVHPAPGNRWTLDSYMPSIPPMSGIELRNVWRVRFVEREGFDLSAAVRLPVTP